MGKGRGGYGGGMPTNMNTLLKQAQKMQKQMEEAQASLETEEVSATAGGGVVEVTVSGKKELTKIVIDKEVVDPEDVETLQDLIIAAANEALRKIDEMSEARMNSITGPVGGGLGGLF